MRTLMTRARDSEPIDEPCIGLPCSGERAPGGLASLLWWNHQGLIAWNMTPRRSALQRREDQQSALTCQGTHPCWRDPPDLVHVFLRPYEGVVTDMNPAAKWLIDVGDGQQRECDEEGRGKYHERVHSWLCRAEHGG